MGIAWGNLRHSAISKYTRPFHFKLAHQFGGAAQRPELFDRGLYQNASESRTRSMALRNAYSSRVSACQFSSSSLWFWEEHTMLEHAARITVSSRTAGFAVLKWSASGLIEDVCESHESTYTAIRLSLVFIIITSRAQLRASKTSYA